MQRQRVTGWFNFIPFAEISPSTSSSYVPFTASFQGKKKSPQLNILNTWSCVILECKTGKAVRMHIHYIKSLGAWFNFIPFAEISPSTSSSYVPFTASLPGIKNVHHQIYWIPYHTLY